MFFMFDIGRTLLDCKFHPADAIMLTFNINENKRDILKKILFTIDYENDVNGLIRNIEYRCGVTFDTDDRISFMSILRQQDTEAFPMEGSKEFTNTVMNEGYEYCIVSNIWKPFYISFKNHFTKFNINAKKHFLSYEMGARKPYGEFYRTVISDLGYDVKNLCIIGDHWNNDVIPMLKLGGKAIWFNHKNKPLCGTHENLHVATTYNKILSIMQDLKHPTKETC